VSYEPNFIDRPDTYGPFDGVLLVLNIGEDNYESLNLPQEYEDALQDALANAHADGWAVIYLFDNMRGVCNPPEHFEFTEEVDFYRLMRQTVGTGEASFSRVASERAQQFESMLENIWKHQDFMFVGRSASIVGLCRVGGERVLFPVTAI